MARKPITQRIGLEGDKEIRAGLKALGDEGQRAFEKIRESADSTNKGLGTAFTYLERVEKSAFGFGTALRDLADNALEFGRNMGDVAKSVGVIGAAFFGLTQQTARAGTEAFEGAQAAGLQTREFGRLSYALKQAGVDAGSSSRLFTELNDAISSDEPNKARTALNALGVSVTRLGNGTINTEKLIGDIAEAFQRMPDGVQKSSLAIDLFGKRIGPRLIPFLNEGRAGIQRLGDEAERLGVVFSNDTARGADAFGDSFDKLLGSLAGLRNAFATPLLEPFAQAMDSIAETFARLRPAIADFGTLVSKTLVAGFERIRAVALPVLQTLYVALQRATAAFNSIFGTNLTAEHIIVAGAFASLAGSVIKFASAVSAIVPGLGTFLRILTGFPAALNLISSGVKLFASSLNVLFQGVRLFMTVFGGIPGLIIAAIAAIVIFLATNEKARTAIINAFSEAWKFLRESTEATYKFITETWSGLVDFFTKLFDGTYFAAFWESIKAGAAGAWKSVADSFTAAVDRIQAYFQSWYDWLKGIFERIVDEARKVASAVTGGVSGGRGNAQRRADGGAVFAAGGGHIRGRGTSQSDSIAAWLSNGEYVQPTRAVKHYGLAFMDAIRSLRFPKPDWSGFANGGMAYALNSAPRTRFADGGLAVAVAGGGRPFHLHLDGRSFGPMLTTDDVIDRVQRFTASKAIHATGRKPSWYRG